MPVAKSLLVLFLGLLVGINSSQAQTLRNSGDPAEIPEPGFTGTQYVDSQGCAFIRAGFDGNVVWVPRVTRDRKMLCGFVPTNAAYDGSSGTAGAVVLTPKPTRVAHINSALPSSTTGTSLAGVGSRVAKPPKGFRFAWVDGRLNANRGPRTTASTERMNQIWTNTVPRKLITQQLP